MEKMGKKQKKAIGLVSGGLDSWLAVKLILDQGVEVVCLNMKTPFCQCDTDGMCFSDLVAQEYNLKLIRIFGKEDFLKLVKDPPHGYGKNINPCIDCRIYLFRIAKKVMEKEGADFVFTGEVLGERPMTQKLNTLKLTERESGLKGKILRPLSARLLEPTIPEKEGWVDREKLLSIQGRSRKPQIALANALKIKEYPTPAGGCLLTDENFAKRLKDSLKHRQFSLRDVSLLKVGRHFRLPSGAKVITGRNEQENKILMLLSYPEETKLTVRYYKSTYALLMGDPISDNLNIAAGICAYYCKEKPQKKLQVKFWRNSSEEYKELDVMPLIKSEILKYLI
jgi:tRNA-specific 2-thiouridylase